MNSLQQLMHRWAFVRHQIGPGGILKVPRDNTQRTLAAALHTFPLGISLTSWLQHESASLHRARPTALMRGFAQRIEMCRPARRLGER